MQISDLGPGEVFGAQFHPEWHLMAWHPKGTLSNERADLVADFLESREKMDGEPFHRFVDMTGYTKIELGFDHIVRLARRRRRYAGPRVKSALFAVRLLSLNIARMYAELMAGARIDVAIFAERSLAAEWLGVPVKILRAPKDE
jgi:hypothetical protein